MRRGYAITRKLPKLEIVKDAGSLKKQVKLGVLYSSKEKLNLKGSRLIQGRLSFIAPVGCQHKEFNRRKKWSKKRVLKRGETIRRNFS